jgi:hypothetical protein
LPEKHFTQKRNAGRGEAAEEKDICKGTIKGEADLCPPKQQRVARCAREGGLLERPGILPKAHSSFMVARPGKKLSVFDRIKSRYKCETFKIPKRKATAQNHVRENTITEQWPFRLALPGFTPNLTCPLTRMEWEDVKSLLLRGEILA